MKAVKAELGERTPSRCLRKLLRVLLMPATEHCGRSPNTVFASYLLITIYWRPARGKKALRIFLAYSFFWFSGDSRVLSSWEGV